MRIAHSISVVALIAACSLPTAARSAPVCPVTPELTLAERFAAADSVVLAKWESAVPAADSNPGSTTFEIVQIPRSSDKNLAKGMRITVDKFHPGKRGRLALVWRSQTADRKMAWQVPLESNSRRYSYILRAPRVGADREERLVYYLPHLEDPDAVLAADAFTEICRAEAADVVAMKSRLSRELLRAWLRDPNLRAERMGLYGLMLGLCGDEADAEWMQERIVDEVTDFRAGIDGLMRGYLVLTGEPGLEVLEQSKLVNKEAAFSETYAAMQALRFIWTHGNGAIPAERLKASMRLLLDRPEVSDLVIADLARWKDWSVQARLRDLYGAGEYNIPSIKRAIVRYMLASTKDLPTHGEQSGKHVADGARYLEELRQLDPKMVNQAERFFFLQ